MATQPEKIVDKNGKQTTVHKRVDAPTGDTARSLPVAQPAKGNSNEFWIERSEGSYEINEVGAGQWADFEVKVDEFSSVTIPGAQIGTLEKPWSELRFTRTAQNLTVTGVIKDVATSKLVSEGGSWDDEKADIQKALDVVYDGRVGFVDNGDGKVDLEFGIQTPYQETEGTVSLLETVQEVDDSTEYAEFIKALGDGTAAKKIQNTIINRVR